MATCTPRNKPRQLLDELPDTAMLAMARCLFVSTGGFTKEARCEADRSAVALTLLTLADLRDLLIEHYDNVHTATRGLVPLRQIYLPAE